MSLITASNSWVGAAASASAPFLEKLTRKPLSDKPDSSMSRIECSSSTTRMWGCLAIGGPVDFTTVFEFERQAQSERRTHAEFALNGDITAVGIHDFAHKRQPKASAGLVGVLTTGYTVEFFKYTLHILACDSITLVCHFDQKIVSFRPHGDKYLSAGGDVLDRVGNDVCDCLSEQIRVPH